MTDTAVFSQLQRSAAQIEKATAAATEITQNLTETSRKINNENNTIGVLLNDAEFARQLKTTMGNLESSTDELDETIKAVQNNFFLKGYFKRKAIRDAKDDAKKAKTQQK